jgi:hypothetical protein
VRRPVKRPNPIVVAPVRPAPAPVRPSAPISQPVQPANKVSKGDSKAASTKSAGKVTDPYAAAAAKAQAQANKTYKNAADSYSRQAKNLEAQATALKHALRTDLKKGLLQQLKDITQSRRQQSKVIREGYQLRYGALAEADENNDKAEAGASQGNLLNAARERNMAVSEAMAQGAGESDTLATMMMSLKNWEANQGEIQRGYFDTLQSINSSLTDLNVDTKTALMNNHIQANADKEQLWTNYFNQRSELYTQLGNTRGQQADLFAQAHEARSNITGAGGGKGDGKGKGDGGGKGDGKGKGGFGAEKGKGGGTPGQGRIVPDHALGITAQYAPGKDMAAGQGKPGGKGKGGFGGQNLGLGGKVSNVKTAMGAASKAFMASSTMMGKSWNNPGVPKNVMQWDGKDPFAAETNMNRLDAAPAVKLDKRPEGATLRKWD